MGAPATEGPGNFRFEACVVEDMMDQRLQARTTNIVKLISRDDIDVGEQISRVVGAFNPCSTTPSLLSPGDGLLAGCSKPAHARRTRLYLAGWTYAYATRPRYETGGVSRVSKPWPPDIRGLKMNSPFVRACKLDVRLSRRHLSASSRLNAPVPSPTPYTVRQGAAGHRVSQMSKCRCYGGKWAGSGQSAVWRGRARSGRCDLQERRLAASAELGTVVFRYVPRLASLHLSGFIRVLGRWKRSERDLA